MVQDIKPYLPKVPSNQEGLRPEDLPTPKKIAGLDEEMKKALLDGMNGRGPGPSPLECLFLAGHSGVSTDAGATISGFHPDAGGLPAWQVVLGLRTARRSPAGRSGASDRSAAGHTQVGNHIRMCQACQEIV